MFKIFISTTIFFFSSNLYSNDNLKHSQLFCPDYEFEIDKSSVRVYAFEFLEDENLNLIFGFYKPENKNIIRQHKGIYSSNIKTLFINIILTIGDTTFSDETTYYINRQTLELTVNYASTNIIRQCEIVKVEDLYAFTNSYFNDESEKLLKEMLSKNKI
tara:strand:+ start:113 stop:589 length:477 start_codon:yes stop_codon:yes gene_type:complete